MDRKELLIAYTKRLWMANTANDITGLLLDYEKDLKLIEEREQVKNCSIPAVVGQSEQLVCECKDEWIEHIDNFSDRMQCKKCGKSF